MKFFGWPASSPTKVRCLKCWSHHKENNQPKPHCQKVSPSEESTANVAAITTYRQKFLVKHPPVGVFFGHWSTSTGHPLSCPTDLGARRSSKMLPEPKPPPPHHCTACMRTYWACLAMTVSTLLWPCRDLDLTSLWNWCTERHNLLGVTSFSLDQAYTTWSSLPNRPIYSAQSNPIRFLQNYFGICSKAFLWSVWREIQYPTIFKYSWCIAQVYFTI